MILLFDGLACVQMLYFAPGLRAPGVQGEEKAGVDAPLSWGHLSCPAWGRRGRRRGSTETWPTSPEDESVI